MTISLRPGVWDSQPWQAQRSEVTRGLSPAPSSTTGKPQPAHCTPTEHSSCPPKHRQHVDRKSQAIETLWSVIQELVPCWRRSIRGQRGHGAGCAGDTMRPWSGTKTSFLRHIFPFKCALAPVTALLFPCFLDLYHILYFPSHQARRNLPYQGWAMQPELSALFSSWSQPRGSCCPQTGLGALPSTL